MYAMFKAFSWGEDDGRLRVSLDLFVLRWISLSLSLSLSLSAGGFGKFSQIDSKRKQMFTEVWHLFSLVHPSRLIPVCADSQSWTWNKNLVFCSDSPNIWVCEHDLANTAPPQQDPGSNPGSTPIDPPGSTSQSNP